ncbi:MAG: TerD family protein [Massilia sp.]|jgi:tellurium resistance protein TerZ|uniref:Tellurium resistance protein TerZ n=1 Tax=Massilia aurea TaxID=373040 RepID=A0A7W9X3Z5_9BURK|nr:TerD family protein [Massilia aurea]MBD8543280.1 TerD family protein [Oxalobacteraceae sp. CFBP 8761]MBD8565931.1 TerD family protein [Oxalobacteraceae sp. CFBP 8763]MBD8628647.1 TerD family protein [Oxalobacteraceae sp. CFBP 8753]MBD8721963.1 TerD family protein [Oxalobacteraceae sp. CFBP 13708]RYE68387.1 MAG: TerD family protein [Oxalobacteraceae bacterium]
MSVNLQKGQKISLDKEAGGGLSRVTMGLGWDAIKSKGFFGFGGGKSDAVDLDASVVMFDESNKPVDVIWFRQLKSKDGSIVHTGDNRTGAGDGDDEQITVDLNAVPASVKALVFTVNSFTGQTFATVENAYCRLINAANQQEVARFNLSVTGSHSAQIMAKLYRHGGEWKMHAIGENGNGRTFDDLMPQISVHL